MKKILYLFMLPLLIISCSQGAKKRSFPKEKFTIDLLLPTSPVKNQGSSYFVGSMLCLQRLSQSISYKVILST